jgi:hypothetical protein
VRAVRAHPCAQSSIWFSQAGCLRTAGRDAGARKIIFVGATLPVAKASVKIAKRLPVVLADQGGSPGWTFKFL